jgi:hypothetical protein
MNNTNNYTAEMTFEKAKEIFKRSMWDKFTEKYPGQSGEFINDKATKWVNGLKLSQSEIRLECEFAANTTLYTFGLTQQDDNTTGVKFNTEKRLTMQDSLVCSEYGIFIGQPSSRTDTTWKLNTFAGFDMSASAAFQDELNSTFYSHGSFAITCNKDIVYPFRGLFNHLYVPQTQQTAAWGVGSPFDQLRGAEDGMITMQPNIYLIGQKGYLPQITVPVALANAQAFARMVVIFRGILAQNSTSVS